MPEETYLINDVEVKRSGDTYSFRLNGKFFTKVSSNVAPKYVLSKARFTILKERNLIPEDYISNSNKTPKEEWRAKILQIQEDYKIINKDTQEVIEI